MFFVLVLVLTASCNKFGDTNLDPTRSSNLDPVNQLVQTQLRFSGDVTINEALSIIMTMPMVQQIGGAWYNRYGNTYIKNTVYMSYLWEVGYPNDVLNIVDAVNRTKKDSDKTNLHQMCRIMKVYLFDRITDLYGDIPYFEAGEGYSDGTVRPKFDAQKDIYNDFFKELTEASASLDASKDAVPQDLYYHGDVAKWKKFANSLRLRLAMRLVKVDPEKAKTEAIAAFKDGVFTSNDDICKLDHEDIQHGYDDIRGNGVSVGINQYPDDGRPRICNTLINEMKKTNDPRLQYIAKNYWVNPDKLSERLDVTDEVRAQIGIVGINPGKYIWDDWLDPITITVPGRGDLSVSNNGQKVELSNALITSDAPFFNLTYAEVEFLLAEADVRWKLDLGGDAQYHFSKGLTAACRQLALYPQGGPVITDAQIQQFIQDNQLAPGKELEMIDTQLWVSLLLNGPEAYANWRRTGYPKLIPGVTEESNVTTIPRRFEYPLSEKEQNAANMNEAVQRSLGGKDDWTGRVWWDKE